MVQTSLKLCSGTGLAPNMWQAITWSNWMMTQFTDAYIRHQAQMSLNQIQNKTWLWLYDDDCMKLFIRTYLKRVFISFLCNPKYFLLFLENPPRSIPFLSYQHNTAIPLLWRKSKWFVWYARWWRHQRLFVTLGLSLISPEVRGTIRQFISLPFWSSECIRICFE